MKIYKIFILIILITYSCSSEKSNTNYKYLKYSDIFDISYTPQQNSKCRGWFSDAGSWYGFTLPSNPTNGFCGPFDLDMNKREWISDALVQIRIINDYADGCEGINHNASANGREGINHNDSANDCEGVDHKSSSKGNEDCATNSINIKNRYNSNKHPSLIPVYKNYYPGEIVLKSVITCNTDAISTSESDSFSGQKHECQQFNKLCNGENAEHQHNNGSCSGQKDEHQHNNGSCSGQMDEHQHNNVSCSGQMDEHQHNNGSCSGQMDEHQHNNGSCSGQMDEHQHNNGSCSGKDTIIQRLRYISAEKVLIAIELKSNGSALEHKSTDKDNESANSNFSKRENIEFFGTINPSIKLQNPVNNSSVPLSYNGNSSVSSSSIGNTSEATTARIDNSLSANSNEKNSASTSFPTLTCKGNIVTICRSAESRENISVIFPKGFIVEVNGNQYVAKGKVKVNTPQFVVIQLGNTLIYPNNTIKYHSDDFSHAHSKTELSGFKPLQKHSTAIPYRDYFYSDATFDMKGLSTEGKINKSVTTCGKEKSSATCGKDKSIAARNKDRSGTAHCPDKSNTANDIEKSSKSCDADRSGAVCSAELVTTCGTDKTVTKCGTDKSVTTCGKEKSIAAHNKDRSGTAHCPYKSNTANDIEKSSKSCDADRSGAVCSASKLSLARSTDATNSTATASPVVITTNANLKEEFEQSILRWEGYLSKIISEDMPHDYNRIAAKSIATLISNWKSPRGDLHHGGVVPSQGVGYFMGFWAWDSWKHAVALSRFAPDLAKDQVRAMFDYQSAEGMIIDCIFSDQEDNNLRNSKPPLAAWAVFEIYQQTYDLAFVEEMLPYLIKYHLWWYQHRDCNHNGICEFGAEDGTLEAAAWESGMDNAIRFDHTKMVGRSMNQESVDLNSFLIYEKELLVKMIKLTDFQIDSTTNSILRGKNILQRKMTSAISNNVAQAEDHSNSNNAAKAEDHSNSNNAAQDEDHSNVRCAADIISNYFYSQERGFFFDREIADYEDICKSVDINKSKGIGKSEVNVKSEGIGKFILEEGTEACIPLWAKIASSQQAECAYKIFTDTTKFATYIPFPTIAADNPDFTPNGYWRGPIWLDQVYFGIEGLRRYGYIEEAQRFTMQVFDRLDGLIKDAPIHENYDTRTGERLKAPHFSWSAASLLLLYEGIVNE